ncbi:MAG: lysylphosphatidylglycerol synthase domain-containing protein [Thermoanaerobaculales bacterium]
MPEQEPTPLSSAPASTASIHTPTEDEERPQPAQPADGEPNRNVSGWQRYARVIAFLILVVVSAYGISQFMAGDAAAVAELWKSKIAILPFVFFFAMIDLGLETVGWAWILSRLGIKTNDFAGVSVCVAGKAGLLLPAQLGRLIRPDLMVRLGRGTLGENLKAEGAVFVLDAISVAALFAGLVAWRFHPLLGPAATTAVILAALFLGNRIANILSGTRLEFPHSFWWSWQAFVIVLVEAAGWAAHGVAFYILTSDLPGNVTLWDALFLAPGSAVIGLASGLPGGLGLTDGLLGASLGFSGVPQAHHALGVAMFRLITFWLLLPIGWLALMWAGRQIRKRNRRIHTESAEIANASPVPVGELQP